MDGGEFDFVERKVIRLLAEVSGRVESTIHPHDLLDDVIDDSLDLIELVMSFEDEFGLDVPDEAIRELRTVQDLIDYVKRRR